MLRCLQIDRNVNVKNVKCQKHYKGNNVVLDKHLNIKIGKSQSVSILSSYHFEWWNRICYGLKYVIFLFSVYINITYFVCFFSLKVILRTYRDVLLFLKFLFLKIIIRQTKKYGWLGFGKKNVEKRTEKLDKKFQDVPYVTLIFIKQLALLKNEMET